MDKENIEPLQIEPQIQTKERSLTPPKASLKKFLPEMDKLKQEINDLKNKNKDLENYKNLMEEYNEIKPIGRSESITSDAVTINNYDKEIQQLQQDIIDRETIMQDLNDANNEIYQLQKRIETLNKTLISKDKEIIKFEKDIKERNGKIQEISKKYNALNKTSENTLNSIEKLEKENKDKLQQIIKLQQSNDDKSRKIQNLEKKYKDLQQRVKSLNSDNDKIRGSRDSIQSRFRSNKTELMQKNKQCKELQFEIKSLNEQLLTYKIKIQSDTKKPCNNCIEYKQQIDKLWDEISKNEKEEQDIQYLYFQISQLKKQVNESNEKLVFTEKHLESTKNKCRKVEIERDQMHTTIIKVRDENERNINNLRREIQTLKEKTKKRTKCLFFI